MRKVIFKFSIAGLFAIFGTYMFFTELNEFTDVIDKMFMGTIVFGYDILWAVMFFMAYRKNSK